MLEGNPMAKFFKRINWKINVAVYFAVLIYIILPLLGPISASMIADACDCDMTGSGPEPCYFMGIDIGPMVYTLAFLAWFFLATVSTGGLFLVAYTIYIIIGFFVDKKPSSKSGSSKKGS